MYVLLYALIFLFRDGCGEVAFILVKAGVDIKAKNNEGTIKNVQRSEADIVLNKETTKVSNTNLKILFFQRKNCSTAC